MILQHLFYDKNPKVYKNKTKQNKTKKKKKNNNKTWKQVQVPYYSVFSQPILTCQIMEIADLLTGGNWQKWKRVNSWHVPAMKFIGMKQLVSKVANILENYEICENGKFGAISWKFDILSITSWLKLEFENSFAHVWHI